MQSRHGQRWCKQWDQCMQVRAFSYELFHQHHFPLIQMLMGKLPFQMHSHFINLILRANQVPHQFGFLSRAYQVPPPTPPHPPHHLYCLTAIYNAQNKLSRTSKTAHFEQVKFHSTFHCLLTSELFTVKDTLKKEKRKEKKASFFQQ